MVTRSKEGLCWVQRSGGGGTPGAGAGPATRTRGELPWLYSGDLWRGPAAGQCANINMDTAQITLTQTHPAPGRHTL